MKILVLRGGALGDFIVTIPAIRWLRTQWPGARMELVGNTRAATLGIAEGLIDATHSQHEARWATLYGNAPLAETFRSWLEGFDLVVNYWPDPEGELAARFPLRTGQTVLAAAAMPVLAPAARHFCEALRPLGCETVDYRSRLPLLAARANDPDPAPIAIHPGSGSPRKNWPMDRWATLCERLQRYASLLIVGTEIDADALALLAAFGEIAMNLPLPELATRLARCRLFLGHDSGVSHLAAAVSTPCVVLFGPSDPAMWAPPGDHVHVICSVPSMNDLSLETVWPFIQTHSALASPK